MLSRHAWGAGSHLTRLVQASEGHAVSTATLPQRGDGMRAGQADERSSTWRDTDPYARVSQGYQWLDQRVPGHAAFFKRTIRSPIHPMAAPAQAIQIIVAPNPWKPNPVSKGHGRLSRGVMHPFDRFFDPPELGANACDSSEKLPLKDR